MPDYKKMYFTLFNAVTDAIEKLDDYEIKPAKEILVNAQNNTEDMYIEEDEM